MNNLERITAERGGTDDRAEDDDQLDAWIAVHMPSTGDQDQTMVDLGGGMVVPLSGLIDDDR